MKKSRWCHIQLAIKPHYLLNHASQIKKLLWNFIRKSWPLFENPSWKSACSAPWFEDWRWRHIRLAIELHYLGNHASRIKSYSASLSGSQGRYFRIRNEKSREALPGGEITMTSYPACNKTSLSRKPCIAEKSYYWSLSGSHGRSFRIRNENARAAYPGGGLTMTSYHVGNTISLSRKPCLAAKMDHHHEVFVA